MVINSETIWCCHCAGSMWFKLCILIMLVACPELIHNTESSFPNKYFCYCDSSSSWTSGDRNTHPRPINFILPIYLLYLPFNQTLIYKFYCTGAGRKKAHAIPVPSYKNMYALLKMCVCMYVCMYVCVYIYMCMHIYIYVLVYIHVYNHDIFL